MSTYCLCFGVEGEEVDGSDKKYIICIDPVGSASLNVGVAWYMGKRRQHPTEAVDMQFNGILIHKESASLI